MADLEEFAEITEARELRKVNARLQRELRAAKAQTQEIAEAFREGARDATLVLGNPPPVPKAKRDARAGTEEVALLHLSDWQWGKVTESFNPTVAGERVDRLAERVTRMTLIERADHPVRECHALLGGDFVEGLAVFPGQPFETDPGLFQQVVGCSAALERLLRSLIATFEVVHVWEEYGNHGRIGRRGDHPKEDNADLFVYRLARERVYPYEQAGRVVWHETTGWHQMVDIGAYRAMLVHGDEVRSFGGQTPAFGIAKKGNAWATFLDFTDIYMGHWHARHTIPLANGRGAVFVNPSLESDNVYAQEFVGATGKPGQRLHFIVPTKGRVSTERILWLDDD